MRVQTAAFATIPVALLLTAAPASPQDVTLDSVLRAAASYLETYERAVTAVIAQEDYRQQVLNESSRRLRSDLLMIADQRNGWVEFRDVFEVDGHAVRDHDERVARLFLKPDANALNQARLIARESARFNLNPKGARFNRTINVPNTALRFLRRQNQPRSAFELSRIDTVRGSEVAVVKFTEQSMPRLIASDENAQARGTFLIEPKSGRIAHSELLMSDRRVDAAIKVDYAEQPEIALWLPVTMEETYRIPMAEASIGGTATYSKFRQFKVDVSTDMTTIK